MTNLEGKRIINQREVVGYIYLIGRDISTSRLLTTQYPRKASPHTWVYEKWRRISDIVLHIKPTASQMVLC